MQTTIRCLSDLEPPECCQPLTDEEWAARTARLSTARKAAYERQPTCCRNCGSVEGFSPVFDVEEDVYDCDVCGDRLVVTL